MIFAYIGFIIKLNDQEISFSYLDDIQMFCDKNSSHGIQGRKKLCMFKLMHIVHFIKG